MFTGLIPSMVIIGGILSTNGSTFSTNDAESLVFVTSLLPFKIFPPLIRTVIGYSPGAIELLLLNLTYLVVPQLVNVSLVTFVVIPNGVYIVTVPEGLPVPKLHPVKLSELLAAIW